VTFQNGKVLTGLVAAVDAGFGTFAVSVFGKVKGAISVGIAFVGCEALNLIGFSVKERCGGREVFVRSRVQIQDVDGLVQFGNEIQFIVFAVNAFDVGKVFARRLLCRGLCGLPVVGSTVGILGVRLDNQVIELPFSRQNLPWIVPVGIRNGAVVTLKDVE